MMINPWANCRDEKPQRRRVQSKGIFESKSKFDTPKEKTF
jgi:hypothetical protein